MSKILSGKVKKVSPSQVSADRYNFLQLSEAEPDLGVPAVSGYFLSSDASGNRSWVESVVTINGATGDITAQDLLDAIKTVDGSGSGLDADLLDGLSIGDLDNRYVDVTGDTMTGDLAIPDKLIHAGDTNTAIRFPTDDTFTVETAGVETVRVDSSNNVGIGTTTPASKLAINGFITESTDGGNTYWNVVTQQDIGTGANEIPLNQYLGSMAYQNLESVVISDLFADTLQVIGSQSISDNLVVGSSSNINNYAFRVRKDITDQANSVVIGLRELGATDVAKDNFTIIGNLLIDGKGNPSDQKESDIIFHVENDSKNGISWKCTEYGSTTYGDWGYTGETAAIRATGGAPFARQGLAFFTDAGSGYPFHVTAERMRIERGTGNVGIGTSNPSEKLEVNGTTKANAFRVSDTGQIDDSTATTTSTTQTAIASWSATTFGGAKVIVEAKDGVNRHITELLITHDGTTAVATEYGIVHTAGQLATYDIDISGGNVRLLATAASSNSTTYKVMQTMLFA